MDYCKGCTIYNPEDDNDQCNYASTNNEGACPCSHCIVKVICWEMCPPFKAFKQEMYDKDIEDLKRLKKGSK